MPSNWSRAKICEELNVSDYLVRKTKELMNEQGVLPTFPRRQDRQRLSKETVELIKEFYESEENSRILPGKIRLCFCNNWWQKDSKTKKACIMQFKRNVCKF